MGLFSRRPAGQSTPQRQKPVVMGSGRKLRSDLGVQDCADLLVRLLAGYSEPRYEHLPPAVPAGHIWLGSGPEPAVALCCNDDRGEFLLVVLWGSEGGTEIGMFPLGAGDDRLTLPMIGHWKGQDRSLSSTGSFPHGSIALQPPVLPPDFLEGTLSGAGFPVDRSTMAAARSRIVQMFLIKAQEFIGSQDQRLAARFVEEHRLTPMNAEALPQLILNDLGAWNPGVLPYIQELPYRVRAILLERDPAGRPGWSPYE